jgi:hypothetical protein
VAIGTKPGLDSVAKVGLDVLLDFVCAPPQCTSIYSSCAWTPASASARDTAGGSECCSRAMVFFVGS